MPVIEQPVHARTRKGKDDRYGCHNKPRPTEDAGYWAPDRHYFPDGRFEMRCVWIPLVMTKDCRNDRSLTDPDCDGCQWRGVAEAHWAEYRKRAT